jgi:hypothetical protein
MGARGEAGRAATRAAPTVGIPVIVIGIDVYCSLVRPEGACHQWRKEPPGELSIDPVADERLGRATERAEAS